MAKDTFTCGHCRRQFTHGIHIGRNLDKRQARYADYCSRDCARQGERRFKEEDARIGNMERAGK